jgi:hydroxymethylpyrimidine pyrophosphatase-like HAD family hydrolase
MIIAVDFDGTLHDAQYPAIGNPMPDAVEVMQKLHDAGCDIVIWTCRESKEQMDMFNWLIEKKIPFDRINDNSVEQMYFYGNDSRKVFADVYIDDRNLGGLPTWKEIYEIINKDIKPIWF